jgi:hypothetical protein
MGFSTRGLRRAAETAARVHREEMRRAEAKGDTGQARNREAVMNRALDRIAALDRHRGETGW